MAVPQDAVEAFHTILGQYLENRNRMNARAHLVHVWCLLGSLRRRQIFFIVRLSRPKPGGWCTDKVNFFTVIEAIKSIFELIRFIKLQSLFVIQVIVVD